MTAEPRGGNGGALGHAHNLHAQDALEQQIRLDGNRRH
jgi:hypothetical protein